MMVCNLVRLFSYCFFRSHIGESYAVPEECPNPPEDGSVNGGQGTSGECPLSLESELREIDG